MPLAGMLALVKAGRGGEVMVGSAGCKKSLDTGQRQTPPFCVAPERGRVLALAASQHCRQCCIGSRQPGPQNPVLCPPCPAPCRRCPTCSPRCCAASPRPTGCRRMQSCLGRLQERGPTGRPVCWVQEWKGVCVQLSCQLSSASCSERQHPIFSIMHHCILPTRQGDRGIQQRPLCGGL